MKKIILVVIAIFAIFSVFSVKNDSKLIDKKINFDGQNIIERYSSNYMMSIDASKMFQTSSLLDVISNLLNTIIKIFCIITGSDCGTVEPPSSNCPKGMVASVSAQGVSHCAIKNYTATNSMHTQGEYRDGCCSCYEWAYWKKLNGIDPGNKYYGQKTCSVCNKAQTSSHGTSNTALTNAYSYIISNNKPVVANVKNGNTDQKYGHWVVFVGVTESSYENYKNNPAGFTARMSDMLFREVYDGNLYNGANSLYGRGAAYWLFSGGVYY